MSISEHALRVHLTIKSIQHDYRMFCTIAACCQSLAELTPLYYWIMQAKFSIVHLKSVITVEGLPGKLSDCHLFC